MGRIARLLQSQIEKYILNVVEAHYSQNQLCYQYDSSGVDAPPLPSDRVVLVPVEGTGNFVSCGVLAVSQGAEPGERFVYSRDSEGNIMSMVKFKNNGEIEIETSDNADLSVVAKGNVNIVADGNNVNITCDKLSVNDGNLEVTS